MNTKKLLAVTLFVALITLLGLNVVMAQEDEGLVIWADDTRAPILTSLGEEFEAANGIPLIVEERGFGDIRDQLRVAGPAGEGPDIIIGASDWVGELVTDGLLSEIDLGDKAEEFLPGALALFQYEGKQYGMPYAIENVALIRNTDLVPDAPTTWEEVGEITRSLVDNGEADFGYIERTNDPYHFFAVQSGFGGYVFGLNEDGSYNTEDVGIGGEGSIAAGQWLSDLVTEGYIPADLGYDEVHELFNEGSAAMIITGPWALPIIRESGVPYAVSALPEGPAGPATPFIGGQGFMINSFSEQQVLAEAFLLEYVATEEVLQAMFEADPRPSAYAAINEQIEDEDIAGFAAAGEFGVPIPNVPAMSSVWTSWGNAMEAVIRQTLTAEEAYTEAAEQIVTALEESE
jgi:maltose/maltodextrin transport system substrate-binding protein/arabinogalactan oligomer/maltooligosaccharide transport system substrate-binding protein